MMAICISIAVPLSWILRGQDNSREAGGTNLPHMHAGKHDGIGHDDDGIGDDDDDVVDECDDNKLALLFP